MVGTAAVHFKIVCCESEQLRIDMSQVFSSTLPARVTSPSQVCLLLCTVPVVSLGQSHDSYAIRALPLFKAKLLAERLVGHITLDTHDCLHVPHVFSSTVRKWQYTGANRRRSFLAENAHIPVD